MCLELEEVRVRDGVCYEALWKNHSGPGWVALCLECHPVHQKVAGSVPGQGAYERQPIDVALSHQCSSLSLSLKSVKQILG